MRKTVFLMLAVLTLFVSCGDDDAQIPQETVFIAGYYRPSGTDLACYWVDGVRHDLTNVESRASGIAVSGSNVYVAGYLRDSGTSYATLWINGKATRLTNVASEAFGVALQGSNVLVCGKYTISTSFPALWVNGTFVTLTNDTAYPNRGGQALGIFTDGNDVYVAGTVAYTDIGNFQSAVWKNGELTRLHTANSTATACWHSGGTTYVVGCHGSEDAVLYRNGTVTILKDGPSPGSPAYAYSVVVDSGDVYVAGADKANGNTNACFWKNGQINYLGAYSSSANGVALYYGTPYLCGEYSNSRACFWTNNIRIALEPATISYAKAIVVKPVLK